MEFTPLSPERKSRGEGTRRRILDAAIAQLALEGMRGLTHRKVEQRAGVAQGSAKHHFGTIEALAEAVLDDLVAADLPLVLEAADDANPAALLAQADTVLETIWSRPHHVRARYALYLHAAERPRLQARIHAARERFVTQIAASLPGPNPERGARFVAAFMDGLLLDHISAPSRALQSEAPTMVLAAGMTGRQLAAQPGTGPFAP